MGFLIFLGVWVACIFVNLTVCRIDYHLRGSKSMWSDDGMLILGMTFAPIFSLGLLLYFPVKALECLEHKCRLKGLNPIKKYDSLLAKVGEKLK